MTNGRPAPTGLLGGFRLPLDPEGSDLAGALEEGEGEIEAGLTIRWGFTPNLTLSGTVNPDYSQVEADALQLTVNRPFAIFYPELRPFFMEGADEGEAVVFIAGADTPGFRWTPRMVDPLLAAGYRVVRFDNRDCGRSTRFGPDAPYRLDDLARLVYVRVEFVGWDRILDAVFEHLPTLAPAALAARRNEPFGPRESRMISEPKSLASFRTAESEVSALMVGKFVRRTAAVCRSMP